MKIALLTIPFLKPSLPSLGLTQIKARLKEVFGKDIAVRLFYLNHDFYDHFGHDLYMWISQELTEIGEWIFRQHAFDNVRDNQQEYIKRFYQGKKVEGFTEENIRKLMNLGYFIDGIFGRYDLDSYDLVGINATFNTVPALAFCRLLKRKNAKIVTVMGGASLYMEMGKALSQCYPHVDYVCSGSGLISFPRLLESLLQADTDAAEAIDGIFSEKNSGKVGKVSAELDLNHKIRLDYDDFFESFDRFNLGKQFEPDILLETSRGCYWKRCKFCGLNEDRHKFTVKRVEQAIEEINNCMKRYNCNIEMVDNVMPRHYIKKVLPKLAIPPDKRVLYEARADYTKEEIETLARSGVRTIQPGIESLSTDVHELMDKGVDAFQCISLLKWCVIHKVDAFWNLIVGFPGMTGEMYENLESILPMVAHLMPPVRMVMLRFDRYSLYWQEPAKYDLTLQPNSVYEYIYPYGKQFLSDFVYYFEDLNYTSERYQMLGKYFRRIRAKVITWQRQWEGYAKGLFPQLDCYSRAGEPLIYDSRQGNGDEYRISLLEEKVLRLLQDPMTLESIKSGFPGEDPAHLEEVLSNLADRHLLFKERDRYLGLPIIKE